MRGGRGLELGHPDLIPLERTDILEDLKTIVDVHRLTDFSLHDRVIPTIELRRIEDEIILSLSVFVAPLAANFSIFQILNQSTFCNLRPVSLGAGSDTANGINFFFDTVAFGAQVTTGLVVDRRKTALGFPGGAVPGQGRTGTAVAVPGALFYGSLPGAGRGTELPEALLKTIVLPPTTAINIAPGSVNSDLNVGLSFKVQFLNPTRPSGA